MECMELKTGKMIVLKNVYNFSRKYPDPHHGGNWKFWRGGGDNGPGNSEGERGFEAKFTSRWLGKLVIFRELFILSPSSVT